MSGGPSLQSLACMYARVRAGWLPPSTGVRMEAFGLQPRPESWCRPKPAPGRTRARFDECRNLCCVWIDTRLDTDRVDRTGTDNKNCFPPISCLSRSHWIRVTVIDNPWAGNAVSARLKMCPEASWTQLHVCLVPWQGCRHVSRVTRPVSQCHAGKLRRRVPVLPCYNQCQGGVLRQDRWLVISLQFITKKYFMFRTKIVCIINQEVIYYPQCTQKYFIYYLNGTNRQQSWASDARFPCSLCHYLCLCEVKMSPDKLLYNLSFVIFTICKS